MLVPIGKYDISQVKPLHELVERATPKKPHINKNGFGGKCSKCNKMVLHNFCENCGQALDWSDN
jgi:rRNA maturation endonuclease Nob1